MTSLSASSLVAMSDLSGFSPWYCTHPYYSGALSRDELQQYGWVQYQGLKPLKTDMVSKLDADSEVIKVKLKVQYTEAMVEQLEQIMYSIKGRDWGIKNHITWQQFQAGN
jgi:hypothetical protein